MMKKKYLILGGLAVAAGLASFAQRKYTEAVTVLSNIEIMPKSISNVKLSFKNAKFDVVLAVTNTTNIDFGATLTSKIVVKTIRVYSASGTYLGKGDTEFFEIELPANSTIDLPPITFSATLTSLIKELGTNYQQYFVSQNFDSLQFQVDINAFGNTITLDV